MIKPSKKKLFAKIGRKTKLFAAVFATFAVALLFAKNSLAYGPERASFAYPNPAPYVTFNSITSDPSWGDERNFTAIKDITSTNASCQPITNANLAYNGFANGANIATSGFSDTATAQNGHCYMVQMFVHNNAAANLNLVATGVKASAQIPTYSTSRNINGTATNAIGVQGQIRANNCGITDNSQAGAACSFWDEAYLTSTSATFSASYVQGSTQYYNNVKNFSTAGFALGDNMIASTGAAGSGEMLGYNQMDGNISGCFQYSGYVTFLVQVTAATPSFTWNKQVRLANSGTTPIAWTSATDSIEANPGDTVQYLLTFANTGNTQIGGAGAQGIVIQDYLSSQLTYVNGSTLAVLAGGPTQTLSDNWLGTNMNPGNGQNIGGYAAGTNAQVQFSAKVPDASQLVCGMNDLQNVAMIFTPSNGSQLVTADVKVNNNCANPCPSNPSVPADNPACKPCPTNPNLPSTSDQCQPPANPCATNPNIPADDAKCVSAPKTGVAIVSTVSLLAFLATAAVLITIFARKKKANK